MAENSKGSAKGPGRPFQPGQSGNPGGRPKSEVSITAWLKKICADENEAEALARAIINQAKEGNSAAIKAVLDRVDGAVVQEVRAKVETASDLNDLTCEQLAEVEAILASTKNPDA